MEKKQIFNPYLPSYEYVPDGEPHVFGDRIYLYGSHDRFNGAEFCLNDYVCYSADVKDLTQWKYEGVIYRKDQDPRNQNIPADTPPAKAGFCAKQVWTEEDLNAPGIHAFFAPDVVEGQDGRYYLYYCMDYLPEIRVAVCDSPAGRYEYLGLVRHADGTALGQKEGDFKQFDPGVFIDDDGEIYLYSGNAPIRPEQEDGTMASQVMKLEEDMLTLKEEPKKLMPSIMESEGTDFKGHEFFEASSIRKINGLYYFVYSSVNSHELCYAVSERPDEGYRYGGTLVDIGDVYLDGRDAKDALNCLGNTHGGIECADGQWYVFYHRQTDRTNYSRQGCAEKIFFLPDGSIPQVEITSCGLNQGPLEGKGIYPAGICCSLRAKSGVTFSHPLAMQMNFPYLTQDLPDIDPDDDRAAMETELPIQYVKNLKDGSIAGYKYFEFNNAKKITLTVRGEAQGIIQIMTEPEGKSFGDVIIDLNSTQWTEVSGKIQIPDGVQALYLRYEGEGSLDFVRFTLE